MIFDKTGTITLGVSEVVGITAYANIKESKPMERGSGFRFIA